MQSHKLGSGIQKTSFEDLLPSSKGSDALEIVERLERITNRCVRKTASGDSMILYSGGVDSGILAQLFSQHATVKLLTMGRRDSPDVRSVLENPISNEEDSRSSLMGYFGIDEIKSAAQEVSKIVMVENLPHFEDCIAFWLAASKASEIAGVRRIISANGPDELFCGYDRFRRILDLSGYEEVKLEISRALCSAEKLRRQVGIVVSQFGLETNEPFLDPEFRECACAIPPELKIIPGNDILRKRIWRCLGRALGISDAIVLRKKKAMQYGMGIHSVVNTLVRNGKIKFEKTNLNSN